MQHQWDADFRDEQQCYDYNRLAGISCGPTTNRNDCRDQQDFIVPDLAQLSDEEFLQRLQDMKREHKRAIELCDKLGLQPRADQLPPRQSSYMPPPPVPVASIDDNYAISPQNYRGLAGDLITTGYCIRKPFRARRAPPRYNVPIDGKIGGSRNVRKEKEKQILKEAEKVEQDMKEYLLEKYLSTCFGADDEWGSFIDENSHAPQHVRRSTSFSQFDDDWRPRTTVPKPFQMTLRESMKSTKSRAVLELERQRAEQRWRENMECSKKFKASPAPANIYVPMYEEMERERERRRQLNVARRQRELHELQKPFAFLRRENERRLEKSRRQMAFSAADASKPDANFRAKPFPQHLFNDEAYARMWEEEGRREEMKQQRAEMLLRSSTLPKNMTKKRPSHACPMSGDEGCEKHKKEQDGRNHEHVNRSSSSLTWSDVETAKHRHQHTSSCYAASNDEDRRIHSASTNVRWPLTNVSANTLSRSLSDLLIASNTGVRPPTRNHKSSLVRSAAMNSSVQKSAQPHADGNTLGSSSSITATQSITGILKNSLTRVRPPPAALRTRPTREAGSLARRWSTKTVEEDQLRREIEDDLKFVVL